MVIASLLQLYMYEFSAEQGTEVGLDGRFAWDGLEDYWSHDDLHPFLLTVDDKLAGFALVQRITASDGALVWDVEDFFVLAKYRRSGLGAFAAGHLFRRLTGPWQIRVLASNHPARSFWFAALSRHVRLQPTYAVIANDSRSFAVYRFET